MDKKNVNLLICEYIHNYVNNNKAKRNLYMYKLHNLIKSDTREILNFFKLLLLPHEKVKLLYNHIEYYTLDQMLKLSEIDLCKDSFKELHAKKYLYDHQDDILPVNYSTLYKCTCGCTKTKVREIQVNSIDEPTTLYAKCIDCGRIWTPSY